MIELRRFAALAALIVMAGAKPACAAETVNVATPSRVIFALPFWIAEHNGYFKDEGIDATIDIVSDGREITRRLQTGVSQFSIVGPDAVFIDAVNGGPMRVVAGIVRKPPLFLIAKPSIKTFAQLRGANIGVLSLTEGSSKLLAKMLKAEGVDAVNVTITQVGGAPARATLLKEGKIDAGMQPVPLNYEAEADGFNNLGWAGKYEPEWQFTTVNANGEWLKRKPEVATGFLRALVRAQQFIWSKPDESARIAADALKTLVAMAGRSLAEAVRLGILDFQLDWSATGLQRIYENMQTDGVLPRDRPFAAGNVTDAEYLRKVQATAAIR